MSLAGLLDRVIGVDGENMYLQGVSERSLLSYNIPVWSWAVLWPPILIFGLWQILLVDALATWEDVILVILLTMEAQAVFIIGHELVHRRTTWERRLGEFLLASASYPQYSTEHVYIHHAKVGMPHDVGSAQKGTSFWRYFPREVVSNLTGSWRVAGERLARRRLSRWHYSNPFWRYLITLGFWYGLVFYLGGIWAVPVFIFLGFGCVFSMKMSNYFQHYGLRRVLASNGRWEKILPRHSWSSDWKFSNWMFFKVQRHADHHSMASRQYSQLQTRQGESPDLPGTYGEMMNLALRPKKWFQKMNPIVEDWRRKHYPEIDDWSAYDSPVALARPDDFDTIIELFATAPRLAYWVERHPVLLDNLHEREFLDLDLPKGFLGGTEAETIARRGLARVYWTHEMGVSEMQDIVTDIPSTNAKETSDIVRNWSNDKAFQISIHVLRQNLSIDEARLALSNLAEASITSVIAAVIDDVIDRVSVQFRGGIAVILVGNLASRDTFTGDHGELLILHQNWRTRDSDRIERRVRETLSHLAKESLLFSTITVQVIAVNELSTTDSELLFQDSAIDRLEILARARPVFEYGDLAIRREFEATRLKLLSDYCTPEFKQELDPQSLRDSVGVSIKKISNIDRLLYLLQQLSNIVYCKQEVFGPEIPIAAADEVFRVVAHDTLHDAEILVRKFHGILKLLFLDDLSLVGVKPTINQFIASCCGFEHYDQLLESVRAYANEIIEEQDLILSKVQPS